MVDTDVPYTYMRPPPFALCRIAMVPVPGVVSPASPATGPPRRGHLTAQVTRC
jgi:hypothetical protein